MLKRLAEPSSSADAAHWDAVEEAVELLLEGNHHAALSALRDAIKRDPRNPYAYYYTGTALFEVGRFDECIAAYRAALKLAPNYLAARTGLAQALRIEGNYREAIAEARRALDQSPGDSDALFALGLAQASAGQPKAAIRSLEAFLESGPEFEIAVEAQAMLRRLRDELAGNDNGDDTD
jgi:tetratricopeptide (TPR) repeat protein